VVPPAPAPTPAPTPTVTPAIIVTPTPAPAKPPLVNKRPVPLNFHTVVTLISGALAAGTWAMQQFGADLSPQAAALISSALVVGGTIVNFLTKEEAKK